MAVVLLTSAELITLMLMLGGLIWKRSHGAKVPATRRVRVSS